MGYDMFNAFNCNYTGALVTEQARLMHKYGLVKAGYNVSPHYFTSNHYLRILNTYHQTAILRWQCADTEWDYILNGTEMKWRF